MNERENAELGLLIQSIAKGNASAIREIYERVGKMMTAVAAVYLKSPADAEEVVSDALLLIVRKAERFRENTNACAWINTIVKNRAKDKLRALARHKTVSLEAAYGVGVSFGEEKLLVAEMLSKLSERERTAIILRYWYGLSLAEIAKELKRSKSAAKYLLDGAEEKLKKTFADIRTEDEG